MQLITLLNVANQTFTTTQNGHRFQVSIYQCNGVMCCDLTIDGTVIVQGQSIASGTPLVPYLWKMNGNGNFIFACQDENCIDYTLFGVTQNLYYLTETELQSAAVAYPDTIKLSSAQASQLNCAATIPSGYLPLPAGLL